MPSNLSITRKPDLDYSATYAHTVPVSDSTGLRVYSDTKPHIWKIADLQKGLILVHNGTETVGEGTGFGLPVLVYSDETYFSATSKLHVAQYENRWVIRKEFIMDRMARNSFRNVILENRKARDLLAFLAHLYRVHPQFRFLTFKDLTRKMNIDTAFVKAKPKGRVTVTYTIDNQCILVNADFEHVKKENLQKIFMLNEQESRFYRKYSDSEGIQLTDEKIGAWDGINAEWACLMALHGTLGFRLRKVENAILRRGREFLRDSLDWVGLDYEINPENAVFEYPIEIVGA